ncbi:MAG TPA: SDR family oxidoreductase [Anaerolineaceae bacterium]|nr:SDR family oxidoreductase [Anaerolineaceae bacterium]HOG78351.1 SDR family oxidoreductase [Anaerolineaceae bacterium]
MLNLVTGATGHIGNVLVRRLLELGQRVRVFILPGEDRSALEGLEIEYAEGNVLDPESLAQAMVGVNMVYHLAGVITILPGKNDFVERVNVQGTRNVLAAARRAGVGRVIYTGSIHAFQRVPHGVLVDEAVPFDAEHAINAYDRSKALASMAVQEAVREGQDAVIACPTGVIGPHDYRLSEMGALIFDWIKTRTAMIIKGAYDFVDVRDVAEGLILAAARGRTGETYILSGQQIQVPDILKLVSDALGKPRKSICLPTGLARFFSHFAAFFSRLTHTTPRFTPYSIATLDGNSTISHAKAERELGFNPRPLRQTISDTVAWLLKNRKRFERAKE